jgi:hypothetical protein
MLTPAHRFLALSIVVGAGCYDGEDLRGTDTHPAFVSPDIHGARDGGVVTSSSSAIIGTGMLSCSLGAPGGGQDIGEVVVMRVADPYPPFDVANCFVLSPNNSWPTIETPMHHWYSGIQLPGDIKHASYFVPAGTCVGFQPYAGVNYTSPYNFLGSWRCRASWELGENWRLWSSAWNIKSLRTAYISCPNGNCSPPW